VWRPIAEGAHLVVRPILSWSWIGALVGIAVVVGLVVAALAARWAGRLDPATALRAE
jgi:ABC-type antimicrobial peptide transport system permease subunit